MSFWRPPVVSVLPLTAHIRELTNAPMSPRYLCLTPSVCLPIGTLLCCHSSSLPVLLSSFLPDYISGDFDSITAEVRAFFSDKVSGAQFAHTLLQVYTHKCIEIKARGLQTDILKFELSWGGRVAAPLMQPSLVRCPAGVPGAGTNVHQWLLLIPNGLFLHASATSLWMWSQAECDALWVFIDVEIQPGYHLPYLHYKHPNHFSSVGSYLLKVAVVNDDEEIPGDLILVLCSGSSKISS